MARGSKLRYAYRQHKRILLRRIISLYKQVSLWDGKLKNMPAILDTPELRAYFLQLSATATAKLDELEFNPNP